MTLQNIKTKTGKTIQDFIIPTKIRTDEQLLQLIMESESMKDEERQYWFNLTEIMTTEQIEKLRTILVREKQKLAEIDAKYNKKKEDPVVARRRARAKADHRAAKQARISAQEKAQEAKEKAAEAAALAELQAL
jgi:hypothetical protein